MDASMILLEGIGQQVSDGYEQEGICYCAGYGGGMYAGGKGINEVVKAEKAKVKVKKTEQEPPKVDIDDTLKVEDESIAVERGSNAAGNIAKNLDTNNIPNMTKQEIIDAIPDNWKYTEHNGFVHIKDEAGKIRIRIDPPDKVTQYPHVHVYDNDGNLLDSLGNIVDRKSPDGHIPYKN